jgi:hypothetical protein
VIGIDTLDRFLTRLAIAAVLVVAAWFGLRHYGAEQYKAGYYAGVNAGAQAAAKAVIKRTKENVAVATKQATDNASITKEKDDEIAALRARLAAAPRMRVGPSICPDRPTAATQAQGPAGGDGADPSTGLVSGRADADFKQLIEAVEQDLATGRACQAFIEKNGFASPQNAPQMLDSDKSAGHQKRSEQ